MPSLTARKQHASTQSEPELETPTKRSTRRFNDDESLFDMPTKSSKTAMMNSFKQEQGESLRSQEGSRPEPPPSEMTPQQ